MPWCASHGPGIGRTPPVGGMAPCMLSQGRGGEPTKMIGVTPQHHTPTTDLRSFVASADPGFALIQNDGNEGKRKVWLSKGAWFRGCYLLAVCTCSSGWVGAVIGVNGLSGIHTAFWLEALPLHLAPHQRDEGAQTARRFSKCSFNIFPYLRKQQHFQVPVGMNGC